MWLIGGGAKQSTILVLRVGTEVVVITSRVVIIASSSIEQKKIQNIQI